MLSVVCLTCLASTVPVNPIFPDDPTPSSLPSPLTITTFVSCKYRPQAAHVFDADTALSMHPVLGTVHFCLSCVTHYLCLLHTARGILFLSCSTFGTCRLLLHWSVLHVSYGWHRHVHLQAPLRVAVRSCGLRCGSFWGLPVHLVGHNPVNIFSCVGPPSFKLFCVRGDVRVLTTNLYQCIT